MPKRAVMIISTVAALLAAGCANDHYNQQRGAVLGAAGGAAAGAIIGEDTRSTLIGTALGGLFGSVIGDYQDTVYDQNRRHSRPARYNRAPAPEPARGPYTDTYSTRSAGNWITVPGQHVGRTYVPPHQVYIPQEPRGIWVER